MSEPRRPEPAMRWTERLRERLVRVRDEVRLRRPPVGSVPALPPSASEGGAHERRSSVFGGLIAVGAALLALGLIWGWQTWSNRSAEPIDDLLPMLVAGTGAESDLGLDGVAPGGEPSGTGAENGSAAAVDASDAETPPDSSEPEAVTTTDPTNPAEVIVHVSGAVARPGVVVLLPGARVFEAVELAGGATPDADLDRVNLAAPLVDGERVHVPTHDEEIVPPLVPSVRPLSPPDSSAASVDALIDINSASASDLEALPGVGPAIAQAIVQTRVDRGPFLSLDELLDVPGIGDMKLAQLRPFAAIGS